MSSRKIPFAIPDISDAEIDEVCDTLRSGWLTTGPKTKKFEEEFAEYVGARFALAVNSATSGLHLALEAIGIGPGDRVITSTHTFTASAEVMRYLGADPALVDIDPKTLNLDVEAVRRCLEASDGIKAIMPVHMTGQACEMDGLMRLADQYGVRVIEDAAHALPTTYKDRMIGTIGDATVFSFYVTKTLAVGEGGMVTTDDPAIADRIRTMRLHGISRDVFDRYTSSKPSWYYEVVAPGFKYNMPDMAAAIGLHQLRRQSAMHARRSAIAEKYNEAFAGLPVATPYIARAEDTHAWHLYILQLELDQLSIDRKEFIEILAKRGVGTSVHFIPLHLHPYWRDHYALRPEQFPVASRVFERIVSLPIFSSMSDQDVEYVIEVVKEVLTRAGN